jgi:hypothetical protein
VLDRPSQSTPSLIADAATQLADLVETEVRLVRAETHEIVERFNVIIGLLVFAGVFLTASLFLLLQAAVKWLAVSGYREDIAALAVGVGIAVLGLVLFALARVGMRRLKPARTIAHLERTISAARETVS